MSSRRALLILTVLATATVVGAAAHLFRAHAEEPSAANVAPSSAPSAIGLRLRAAETAQSGAPQPAAALQETATVSGSPAPGTPRRPAAVASTPSFPLPPRRPADLLGGVEAPTGEAVSAEASPTAAVEPSTPAPLPPVRPRDLAGDAPPAAEAAVAPGAETLIAAPSPPVRPRDLAAESAPVAEAAAEILVPAPLPPPRPRDLDAADAAGRPASPQAPSSSASQEIAAHTSPPTPRAEPNAVAEQQPSQPPHFVAGAPAYVRIFKKESELELWLKVDGRYALFRTFQICKWSGRLGPKTHEADYQSPEGFYSVSAKQLNPRSNYHLAFNVGYPNAFDKQNGRTGGLVMVHGNCKSVGCFAMTDRGVDEIYHYVAAALNNGQREVAVHIFPFRMTETAIAQETSGGFLSFLATDGGGAQWAGFWRNLKEGYDLFERTGEPPTVFACGDHYAFSPNSEVCSRIAGW
ncbi:MAG TPA: L,D-transpeptidase family protein [Methylocystis sp.]|nr:L,D-transpeptidase family protein [Methylocystis sp.]HXZ16882.1 L,D-transpeptidase family protein [Roseiarcus sp.]